MRKLLLALLFPAAAFLGACSTVPVTTMDNAVAHSLSEEQVKKAITLGATDAGWVAKPSGPNSLILTLTARNHEVVIDVPYSKDQYSFRYKSSRNMKYNEEKRTIHPKYQKWLAKLRSAINRQLAQM